MCLSWKCVFSIMSFKNRRFSLDSSVNLDGVGVLGARRGSNGGRLIKKSKQTVDDARMEIQEINPSLNANMSLREQTIAEEGLDRTDGLVPSYNYLKHNKSFHKLFEEIPETDNLTHSRCDEPIMTSEWGVPLVLALLLLGLLYAFLYLPATAQRALLEQALSSNNTTTLTTPKQDWLTDE